MQMDLALVVVCLPGIEPLANPPERAKLTHLSEPDWGKS